MFVIKYQVFHGFFRRCLLSNIKFSMDFSDDFILAGIILCFCGLFFIFRWCERLAVILATYACVCVCVFCTVFLFSFELTRTLDINRDEEYITSTFLKMFNADIGHFYESE